MTDAKTTKTVGDVALKLHRPIIDLVAGRGTIARDELKREAASMSGRSGASANALASVAIHQLEREGRIVRSASGKSWRLATEQSPAAAAVVSADGSHHDVKAH